MTDGVQQLDQSCHYLEPSVVAASKTTHTPKSSPKPASPNKAEKGDKAAAAPAAGGKPDKPARPRGRPATRPTAVAARAMTEMTEDLRKEVDDVRAKIDKLTDYDIEVRYEIGEKLNVIKADTSGRYGTDPEKQMYAVMPLSRDAIRPMMVLAKTYSRDEVKRLRTFRNPQTHEGLTWSHVVSLVRVKDKARAFALAEKAAAQGMSSRDLNAEVIRVAGGPKSKGGRKAKKVGSLVAALEDIRARSRQWQNASTEVWLGAGGMSDLYAAESAGWVGKRPPQELVDDMAATADVLEQLRLHVNNVALHLASLSSQAKAARAVRASVT